MIFLVGHRSAGKTTVSHIFSQSGFWIFDTGPFLRNLCNGISQSATPETLLSSLRLSTKNSHWDDEFLASTAKYGYENSNKKDLLILGYRSLNDLLFIKAHCEKIIPELSPALIVYVDSKTEIAYQRYIERENHKIDFQEFTTIHEREIQQGLGKIKTIADFVIENNSDLDNLKTQVDSLIPKLRL